MPGSLYQRKSDGRWVATWYDDRGTLRHAYGRTPEDAIDRRRERQGARGPDQTLGQYLDWWTGTHLARRVQQGRLQPTTASEYAGHLRRYVPADLRAIPLAKLTAQHLDDWLADLASTPSRRGGSLSSRTVAMALETLRAALNVAVRYDLIERNPATLVDAPAVKRDRFRPWSRAEVRRFLEVAMEDRLAGMWALMLGCGLRVGEACAIPVHGAVDLDARTVRVRASLAITGDGTWIYKPTKEEDDTVLALPRFAVEALARRCEVRELERMMADEDARTEFDPPLLFCRADGKPLRHRQVQARLTRLCTEAGVPRVTCHKLRHQCASLLSAQGASLQEIQAVLRHATGKLTSDLYTHLLDEVRRDHADRLDDLLG